MPRRSKIVDPKNVARVIGTLCGTDEQLAEALVSRVELRSEWVTGMVGRGIQKP